MNFAGAALEKLIAAPPSGIWGGAAALPSLSVEDSLSDQLSPRAAFIYGEEINEHRHPRDGEAAPKYWPLRSARAGASGEPRTGAEVAEHISHAAIHDVINACARARHEASTR